MTIVLAVCVLAGVTVAGVGILFIVPSARFAVAATGVAEGTIVGHDRKEGEEAVYYYPQVAFTTDGTGWVMRGRIGHSRQWPPVGTRIRVYFPPGDPGVAELSRFGGVWAAAGVLLVGIGLIAGAAWELARS